MEYTQVNLKNKAMKVAVIFVMSCFMAKPSISATMYSNDKSYMGSGMFYGPGNIQDSTIFNVVIRNIAFPQPLSFVTPFLNSSTDSQDICGERQLEKTPDGLLSDGISKINENVDACPLELNNLKILVAIVDGGPHQGQQIATTTESGEMIMTMDFALDMGIGKDGIIKVPFYGTTGEVTVPPSLQTQLGIAGGIDRAGSFRPGDKLQGRLGDFNSDGMLDGAIVVAGNMPLDSVFLPGAPYALIRYFDTDIPYEGRVFGRLPNQKDAYSDDDKPMLTVVQTASHKE